MCHRAGRVLQKLYEEFGSGNGKFAVVGIFVAEDPRAMDMIRTYKAEHGATFPVVQGDRTIAVNWLGISPARPNYHVPVFFFVAPDGQILEERDPDRLGNDAWFGSLEANLETTIRRLMPPDPPARRGAKGGKKATARKAAVKKATTQ